MRLPFDEKLAMLRAGRKCNGIDEGALSVTTITTIQDQPLADLAQSQHESLSPRKGFY